MTIRTWLAGAVLLALSLLAGSSCSGPSRASPNPSAVPQGYRVVRLTESPGILGPTVVDAYRLVRLQAVNLPPKSGTLWSVYPPGKADLAGPLDRCCLQFVAPPGTYTVELLVIAIDEQGIPQPSRLSSNVTIRDPGPTPTPPGPTPPGPTPPVPPGPTPTPPGPTPEPAPIPTAGFRVLIVYETAKVSSLPAEQAAILYARQVRDYLDSKCVLGPDGKTREWRIWDQDVDTAGAAPLWRTAMARKRASVPWIVISDGKTGYEGPLPATVAETMALLKKYGGN